MFEKFKSEKGQSMVEFALILPILLILVFGIIDFGWLYSNQAVLNNCAREGARFAAVNTDRVAPRVGIMYEINRIVPDSLQLLDRNNPNSIIVYSNEENPPEGNVKISLRAEVKVLTPIAGIFIQGQKKILMAEVTMKVES